MKLNHFRHFTTNISGIALPENFTFPFYYEPHALAKIAAKELQDYLKIQTDFKHSFGLHLNDKKNAIGKMFGVLVVKNQQNELGYLTAFSGKLEDESCPEIFVPPVFDLRSKNSFYKKGKQKLRRLAYN
ncbi:hypothetical protein [Polaribacter batillariae]|uniref:hypothetical protein n=1 Tax=Polaribacter batillariae TaxID=2808900 RepID=UPI00349E4C48